jgi:uncharacterized membrane protein YraQ (UPF0718 family)
MINYVVYRFIVGSFWQNLYDHYLHSYTKKVIDEIIFLIIQLLPYLIIGIIISTVIKQYASAENLKKIISGKNTIISILVASLLGIVSPLGSYVVIPLSAALVTAGLPLSPMVAFMVSSPLINPGLFLLTLGAFGPEMAIMRCVSAFLLGISAGFITQFAISQKYLGVRLQPNINISNLIKKRTFFNEALQYTKYISKHFFIGILIAALTKALIPVTWISNFVGQGSFLSIISATIAGVPLYSCGGAAIPVMQQLSDMGVDKGAILAFFISGPATKVANVVLLTSIYKKGITYVYFAVSIIGAILLGMLYHFL